jgi:hypothetical protein
MTDFQILIRDPDDEYGEKKAMTELGIEFVENRSRLHPGKNAATQLVIGRYSVLPFYKELEDDIKYHGGFKLINNYSQFRYCSDLGNWYETFGAADLTPQTWTTLQAYLSSFWEGPVVLKGETNSRRDKWLTHMFANNKEEAREVYWRLQDDSLISQQNVYIRRYEPLKKLIDGVNKMPIPNEWRVFVCYGEIVTSSYYWGTYIEDIRELGIEPEAPPANFLKSAIARVGLSSNFYTLDVAQKANGEWTIIELNEGQMSGLNGIEPIEFYTNLKKILDSKTEL